MPKSKVRKKAKGKAQRKNALPPPVSSEFKDKTSPTWYVVTMFGLMAWVILDTVEDSVIEDRDAAFATEGIADLVLSPFLIPFLAVSFILLAAAIGSIVLARKD